MTAAPLYVKAPSFGTKAGTLESFRPFLHTASILPSICVRYQRWVGDHEGVLAEVESAPWGRGTLIVRSSAVAEDSVDGSQAGRFHTEANTLGRARLIAAVDRVFASYAPPDDEDQVLIQPMLTDSLVSGVATGRDHITGGPYRVINWAVGRDTAAVTSGRSADVRTWYVASSGQTASLPAVLRPVLGVLDEVQDLTGTDRFEVEFAISALLGPVVFQIRPLAGDAAGPLAGADRLLAPVAAAITAASRRARKARGQRTAYGIMPDWNPAEMIGTCPRKLAFSLYRYLITDQVWARARRRYGYRDMVGVPLMADFGGLGYIDVRASFSSLLPRGICDTDADRIVEHCVDMLADNPALHDKVEFQVAVSCWGPGTRAVVDSRFKDTLGVAERDRFCDLLRRLTERVIAPDGPWRRDIGRVARLSRDRAAAARLAADSMERVEYLLASTMRNGSLPFAGLARAAFVATEVVDQCVAAGAVPDTLRDDVLASASAVTSTMVREFHALSRIEFLARYGHLRPGTYNILSPRYDEAPDHYFDWASRGEVPGEPTRLQVPESGLRAFGRALEGCGLPADPVSFLSFVTTVINHRESAKLEFSRNLSDALQALQAWGERRNLSTDDLSHIHIEDLLRIRDVGLLRDLAARGRETHARTQQIKLPPVITAADDIRSFEMPATMPNFITQRSTIGDVALVERGDDPRDRIAFVLSADPGYDWIFTHRIRGLVTAYGGVNSHMAIRARELGLPAVTGAGEVRYREWSSARRIELDAANQIVRILPWP